MSPLVWVFDDPLRCSACGERLAIEPRDNGRHVLCLTGTTANPHATSTVIRAHP